MGKRIRYDQDEHDAGGGAGGAAASQDGAGAGAGAGAAAAQAGAGGAAGSQAAGTQGQHQAGAGADLIEIVYNGQKVQKTREEVIALAQQSYDYTQKSQTLAEERKQIAQSRKDYQARLLRLEQIEAEMKKGGAAAKGGEEGEGGEPDPDKPFKELGQKVSQLEKERELSRWEKAYTPVAAKYPDISEEHVLFRLGQGVQAGEWDDDANGLMKAAEAINNSFDSAVTGRLDKLLADPENPKVKEHDAKVIADYVANKGKLANAGGDKGAGGSGTKTEDAKGIDEVADKYLAR